MQPKKLWLVLSLVVGVVGLGAAGKSHLDPRATIATGSVIFLHPDGTSAAHWMAARLHLVGPDGYLQWDMLPALAIYRGHMGDSATGTSHGGGTVHAYGMKVPADSYGMAGSAPLVSLSGQPFSVMTEALRAGKAVGIVNSGGLHEPGTGAFLASVAGRANGEAIALQLVASGAQVLLGGGEKWFLPKDFAGRHGPGVRADARNLIAEAEAAGYAVVYTRDELAALPEGTAKVLGLFAHHHTFFDEPEEVLKEKGLPLYVESAPTVGEMTAAALRVLGAHPAGFFLAVEEEGTDNFGNNNHASGTLEALRRADAAIGVARQYLAEHPQSVLILTAADSDAGGMEAVGSYPNGAFYPKDEAAPVPERDPSNGAPFDGIEGTGGRWFWTAPDAAGKRHPFAIAWSTRADTSGGILTRAEGLNQHLLSYRGTVDNTDIYRLIYATLFGRLLP